MDHTEPPHPSPSAHPMLHERATLVPGVLALFGFQLLAVFSSSFRDGLDRTEQRVHLVAILLVALAIAALLMPAASLPRAGPPGSAPGAMHAPRRSLVSAMLALALAIPLELFLAACVILRDRLAFAVGGVALAVFLTLWVVPFARRSS
jgi:uncharacterized protein DUF6328